MAVAACAIPLCIGFLLPAGLLLRLALTEGDAQFGEHFLALAGNSFVLAGLTALIAVALALLLAYGARVSKGLVAGSLNRLVGLGYAVPGSVIAVGVLIPVTRLDNWLAAQWEAGFGSNPGLLLTGGIAALIYAYLVRFLAVALQSVELESGQGHAEHGRSGAQSGGSVRAKPCVACICRFCAAVCSRPVCWSLST